MQTLQQDRRAEPDLSWGQSSAGSLVPHDPVPRHGEERRLVHEVGKVIEAVTRLGHRPSVSACVA